MPDPAPHIRITEVGPRDGLQNEAAILSVEDKVLFVELLAASGLDEIEVSSFVSPRWVPQLADADEVFARVRRREGVVYSALVPNLRGLERAVAAGVDKVAVFTAASETFARRNTNATIAGTIERFRPVVARARAAGLPLRAYVSCVVACPFEGPIEPRRVRDVVARLLDLGADEVDLGETIGVAVPDDVERLYDGLAGLVEPGRTTLHLHDTRGTALACAVRAVALGVRRFDASCAGLGGCPYAPGAAGTLATEDLVYLCEQSGWRTDVDLEALFAAGRHIAAALGRPLPGRVFTADGASAPLSGATGSR
ncbi:MAG: hydroxymethylglutaryl-CoA lyase [Planctomycetota bacterium]